MSATTSLVDAAEVTHRLIKDFNLPRIDESELLQKAIAPNFLGLDLGEGMIWEQRVGRFGNTENTTP